MAKSERTDYERECPGLEILEHPDDIEFYEKRQFVLDNVQADAILQIDDDVTRFCSLAGMAKRYFTEPADVMHICTNVARNAWEAGTPLFGFAHTPNPRETRPQHPVKFTGYIAGHSLGFIRDPFRTSYRFDPRINCKIDVDITMQVLARHRFIWNDTRFCFVTEPFIQNRYGGGFATIRTEEVEHREIEHLNRKWAGYLKIDHTKTVGGKAARNHIFVKVKR